MIGTFQPNIFDRLSSAWRALKAAPNPGAFYPPPQSNPSTGWISWQGWPAFERERGRKDEENVKKALRSVWAYSDVMTIANELSAAELVIKEYQGDTLEDVDNHPLELLWERPNPHLGRSFLVSYWAQSYTLAGKAYLYWMPSGGEIAEVWPVPPFMVQPIPDEKNFIKGYAFKARPEAKPIVIPPEYITYSHSVNLFDIRDGLSFLAAAMVAIESDLAMAAWNKNFFDEQNGIPDGLLSVHKDTLDSDLARIRSEIRDFFGGTRRGVAIARETDMKYQPWGRSQKDAEFITGRDFESKEIDRALLFPEGYWSETANRANAEQARATMIAGAVWPLAVRLAEDLNISVVPRWYGENYRAEFKDIRPENRELKLQEIAARKDYWTVNELRELDGKDPLEDPRGEMFVAEITKGTPLPATPAGEMTEDYIAEQEAAAAEEMPDDEAAMIDEGAAVDELPPEEGAIVPMKAADLDRWERKALKSLKRFHRAAVKFESDAIPAEEQARIYDALKTATSAQEVRAAFHPFVKAAAPNIQERLRHILEQAQQDAADAIMRGGTPDFAKLDAAMRSALVQALTDEVLSGVASQVTEYGLPMDAAAPAAQWAASYTPDVVEIVGETTRKEVQAAVERYRATPGMTRQELVDLLTGTFGAGRAEEIATTEITRAAAQATLTYNEYLRAHGLDYEMVWRTNADERVCPICGPRNEQVVQAADIPPAHPRCRCMVTQRLKR